MRIGRWSARTLGPLALLVASVELASCSTPSTGQSIVEAGPPRDAGQALLEAAVRSADAAPRVDADPPTEAEADSQDAAENPAAAGLLSEVPPLTLTSWDLPEGVVKRGLAHQSYSRGLRALRREALDEAERHFSEALLIDAGYEMAFGALAVVRMRTKRYEACVEVSRRCVQSVLDEGTLGACYYNLGKCQEHLGLDEAALTAYQTSLEARPSDIVERALAGTARRLRRKVHRQSERARREALVQDASRSYLRSRCKGPITTDERTGAISCGVLSTWGAAGSFSTPGVDEVLLAVTDGTISHAEGGGFGALLRRGAAGGWQKLLGTTLLAPGEGGVDFLGTLTSADGSSRPVVQVSDCWQGCCLGSVRVLGFEGDGESRRATSTKLLSVGLSRGSGDSTSIKSIVTGARPIDEDQDGPAGLLLRYESRLGRANPAVSYPRLSLVGGEPVIRGGSPVGTVIPECARGAGG